MCVALPRTGLLSSARVLKGGLSALSVSVCGVALHLDPRQPLLSVSYCTVYEQGALFTCNHAVKLKDWRLRDGGG